MTPRSASRTTLVFGSLVWPAAVLVSVAWLSGLVSTRTTIGDPDFMWRPLSMSDGTRLAFGLTATVAAVGCGWLVHRAARRGELSRTWRAVLIPVVAIAAYGGLTYDAVTAPVIGANIGGGLMLIGAIPFVVAMGITSRAMAKDGGGAAPVVGTPPAPQR